MKFKYAHTASAVTFLKEMAREIGLGCDVVEVGVAQLHHVTPALHSYPADYQ